MSYSLFSSQTLSWLDIDFDDAIASRASVFDVEHVLVSFVDVVDIVVAAAVYDPWSVLCDREGEEDVWWDDYLAVAADVHGDVYIARILFLWNASAWTFNML